MVATPSNSLNITAAGLVKFDGTATFTGVTTTQHDLLIGAASNGITNVAPSATSGVPVISQGASSDPAFGTAVVAGGGTGQVTLTNHGVLVGAGTSAITQLAAGSAGQVLQSGGASADPAYSTATYPVTAGTSGNILTSNGTNIVSSSPAGLGSSLVLIQSQNASNVASISFTTGITSTYKTYLFVMSNYSPVTSATALKLLVSTDTGSTYITSGYGGGTGGVNMGASGSFGGTGGQTAYLRISGQNSTTQPLSASNIWCYNISNGQQPIFTGYCVENFSTSTGNMGLEMLASSNSNTTINAFQFIVTSGNISTGTFSLYGLRES